MDEKEWIPHTTKSGKILYYFNPATGECKWQSQLNKKVNLGVHSKQLEDVNQPCSLQEHYKEDGTSVPSSASHVLSSQETQLMQKHTVDSRCVVATCKKEGKKSYSQLDGNKCGKEVDLPAESKPAHIHCVENGALNILHSAGPQSGYTEMANGVSEERTVQHHILQCPECHQQFSCPNKLALHLRSHPEVDPLKCPLCSKEYSSSTSLTTHLRIHTGERPFSCSHCHKSFNQSSHLTTHMRVHTGEKPYKCPQCPKMFGQSSHLTLHLRIHNGEKPFHCSFCAKGFSHSSALSTHIRTHTGEKPFQCPHCSKKFGQSSHLKIHVRTHTGERPFQCHHCQKSYRQSCYLSKHLKSHSSDKKNL